jgi:recombination DNA repair RAD52 pathway protein
MMKKKASDLYTAQTQVIPKKYKSGDKTIVVLPPHIVKKNLNDYAYGKDIDEKVVKMAANLAEKMAASLLRELSVDTERIVERVISGVTDKIEAAIPSQQTIIREVARESSDEIKKAIKQDFDFTAPEVAVDRSEGLELKGDIGKKTKKKGSLDEQLDALDNLL